jgi:hypothetical protein
MTTFDKREQAYEAQLAHDEDLRFKATVRRNRRLGLWAAQKLGKSGADAEVYATDFVAAVVREQGDDAAAFRLIRTDFDKAGVAQSDHQVQRQMEELMAAAVKEVMASG